LHASTFTRPLAILLQEEELYERCKIYATDMNAAVLKQAEAGVFRLDAMKEYAANYLQANGTRSFSEYYTAKYGNAILSAGLRKNILFNLLKPVVPEVLRAKVSAFVELFQTRQALQLQLAEIQRLNEVCNCAGGDNRETYERREKCPECTGRLVLAVRVFRAFRGSLWGT
jgi:hypothetical protein